jgi:hypothetical protein
MPDVTGIVIVSASLHANLHHFVAGKATQSTLKNTH